MPGVGIGIIILNEKGQVLLILRNSEANKARSDMRLEGTWTLPAGKVKSYETLFMAAKRKAKEEVDLNIDDLEVVSIADDMNEYASFLTLGVLVRMWDGHVSLGSSLEHVDYKFFDLDDLPSNLCSPSAKIIRNYQNKILYMEEK